ncbi:alpha/beta hydrolase family esterase [Sphingomonas montana]|uniref:extracellular catalytic domain type 1 short-chain-length polyhydroxyalkanoate depolymerase n=1 Tax=Sphingomonas montana TaxID=1843236 RepID=UPI00096BEEDA|nr:PHB depolymerase family esterase [Sphingomonas montana]
MRNISDTIARLTRATGLPAGMPAFGTANPVDRLTDLVAFGDNPGGLRARTYVPADLPPGAPLVVVLHGCTQTAAGYDHGSGWSRLADRHGFALLFPEQRRANNPNLCFNWFVPGDTTRGDGEALSIRNMVAQVTADHVIDPARVFVTGLSAGGAMTAVMLATYPDVFAGGAAIAGLPYGSATTVPEAFDRMRGHGGPSRDMLAARARDAAGHDGRWPTLSIWQGAADQTVAQTNADAIAGQWRDLHGLADRPTQEETIDGHRHRVWHDAAGRSVLEEYRIAGMGHGTPLNPSAGTDHGTSGAYMLDAGIASSHLILRFWDLETDAAELTVDTVAPAADTAGADLPFSDAGLPGFATPVSMPMQGAVGTVIENALRTAGLMK